MAGIQAFDAGVQSLAALRRGRLAVAGRVVAMVRALVARIDGAKQAVIAIVLEA